MFLSRIVFRTKSKEHLILWWVTSCGISQRRKRCGKIFLLSTQEKFLKRITLTEDGFLSALLREKWSENTKIPLGLEHR